jgi:hypothetical protein
MFEYAKLILPKVSFSRELFQKELIKCINWIDPQQLNEFRMWCDANFKEMYPDILEKELANIAA